MTTIPQFPNSRSTLSTPKKLEVARAFKPLLAPKRYKGAYGGRGSAKSHFFAGELIWRCSQARLRCVCIREVQNSIRESVRQLLIDKIGTFDLGDRFTVLEQEIRGRSGSLIVFKGMQSFNSENIKSLEGYDIAWVEEAQNLSETSLRLLRPTIRKPGSELWFSWNPRHETDAVDRFFRGGGKRGDTVLAAVNWHDNPWFPDVLNSEKESDYASDPEMADHVWGGAYEIVSEASYYARLVAEAERQGRIGDFPHDPGRTVVTSWDIGIDDYTAIWFLQDDGIRVTAVDYHETSGQGAEEIVREALPELQPEPRLIAPALISIGRERPYAYGEHFFPHDVKLREWGAGGRSRALTLMGLGVKPIRVGAQQGPAERVNAARALLPLMRFNRTKRVMLGLSRLRRYARRQSPTLGGFAGPLHDINSHGADAFGEYAINCPLIAPKPLTPRPRPRPQLRGGVFLEGPPVERSIRRTRT
ncbi:PBSX family phage terminase large subunit [Nordella sp. HKS 07]|uniref:PBSX family phage terminase large subunit n=1 Tax=Nordella sp. HKS 07 TaxID=2712222 RepID=UPI0013E111F1|nr:PBSX family phage terminase large subunit [Nordella sp. HKS 07]QIG49209.1 PBSX family phage terminase large subunit [Nordella sp. HKS 07]